LNEDEDWKVSTRFGNYMVHDENSSDDELDHHFYRTKFKTHNGISTHFKKRQHILDQIRVSLRPNHKSREDQLMRESVKQHRELVKLDKQMRADKRAMKLKSQQSRKGKKSKDF